MQLIDDPIVTIGVELRLIIQGGEDNRQDAYERIRQIEQNIEEFLQGSCPGYEVVVAQPTIGFVNDEPETTD